MTTYWVYIVASRSRCVYVGSTCDLARRIMQHRAGTFRGFTARYRAHRLVHYEQTDDARVAVRRERQLKGWTRARKTALIEATNPSWSDLAAEWGLDPIDPTESGSTARADPSLRSG